MWFWGVFGSFFLILLYLVPSAPYWRDSGEFLLAAYYLDIPHPAGFPIYSQFANLFALLPLGPIPFRIHLFSICVFLATTALLAHTFGVIARSRFSLSENVSRLFAIGIVAIPLQSSAVIRQLVTAEVYVLHAFFGIALFLLYFRYITTKDLRYLLLAAFVAALGLGNHVSLAVSLPVVIITMFMSDQRARRLIVPGTAIGVFALLSYGYLPARGAASPPLNTGQPTTISAFWNHISVARDRNLRSTATVNPRDVEGTWARVVSLVKKDLETLASEISPLLLCLSIFGGIFLLVDARREAIALLSLALGNWFFFLGWDPDPWILFFLCLCFLTCYGVARFFSEFPERVHLTLAGGFAAIMLFSTFNALLKGVPWRAYNEPVLAAESMLDAVSPNSVLITDASWFLQKYLRHIEGARRDVTLVYGPALYFPEYFHDTKIKNSNGELFDTSSALPDSQSGPKRPITRFLSYAAPHSVIYVEPHTLFTEDFHRLIQLNRSWLPYLQQGHGGGVLTEVGEQLRDRFAALSLRVTNGFSSPRADARNYYEHQVMEFGALLSTLSHSKLGHSMLDAFCKKQDRSSCSPAAWNNMANFLFQGGNTADGLSLLAHTIRYFPTKAPELKLRFRALWRKVPDEQKETLLSNWEILNMVSHLSLLPSS